MSTRHALLILRVLIAVSALAGAGLAIFVSLLSEWLACENGETEACSRHDLAVMTIWVAVAGVPLALLFAVDAVRNRRRSLVWLGLSATVYIAWGLFLDASIHGWDDLVLVP